MSRTPAAELARVKVSHPSWAIIRTPNGLVATRAGKSITVRTVGELAHALHAADTTGPRKPGE